LNESGWKNRKNEFLPRSQFGKFAKPDEDKKFQNQKKYASVSHQGQIDFT
jgi:hypothetical protein